MLKPYIHTVFGNLQIHPFYKPRLFQTQNALVKVGVPHLNPLLGDSLYNTYPPTTNPEGPNIHAHAWGQGTASGSKVVGSFVDDLGNCGKITATPAP
jgi:hypothetical protein